VEDNLNLPPPPQHYVVEGEKVSVMVSLVVAVAHWLVAVATPSWSHGGQTMDDDWSPATKMMTATITKLRQYLQV